MAQKFDFKKDVLGGSLKKLPVSDKNELKIFQLEQTLINLLAHFNALSTILRNHIEISESDYASKVQTFRKALGVGNSED